MKIKTEEDLSCKEPEVIIRYSQKDKQINRIIDFLQSFDMQIKCSVPYRFSVIPTKKQITNIWFCANQQIMCLKHKRFGQH